LYMRSCTPSTPIGPAMVGVEGTCRIWAQNRLIRNPRCMSGVCGMKAENQVEGR
ncbi:MAG TPA: hypothetical protein ENF79_03210, partial [Nitrososphaeria archaeon]|nr:hypothetical protein [Nitrososphaeria archaeon]